MRKFFIFVATFFVVFPSFAGNAKVLVSDLTIKELSQNIEKLKEEKQDFLEKNKAQSQEYGELISFIRTDLTPEEITDITQKVNDFLAKKAQLESDLKQAIEKQTDTENIKKEIILNRADFYKYIAKYVQKEKRESFIAHIKFQVQSEKESKDLIDQILTNQNILDQKVNYIKGKIETHKEELHIQIEKAIDTKIKQRIEEIDTNPKYAKIDKKTKNKIYTNFISQIEKRLSEVDKSNLTDNYKEMKKNILHKMIDEIQLKIKDQK